MISASRFHLFSSLLVLGAYPALAQGPWTWTGCPNVTDADFAYNQILRSGVAPDAGISEPIKMDFDMDANGNVDIYYVQRTGAVKRYNAAANTVNTLGTLPVFTGPLTNGGNVEEGLTGIVLDPNFKTNHYIYLHWSPAAASVFRISRYTVSGNTIGGAVTVLEFPAQRTVCCHTGGGMAFDAYGDLWIAQGNNSGNGGGFINETNQYDSDEWGASNTAGLRGGILRIHPTASGTYTIPTDNFGEYFARTLNDPTYSNTTRVRPEIYAKGTRNAYSLTVDPVRRWVTIGNVGADIGAVSEEHDLLTTPGFQGWPYFHGNNLSFVGNKNVAAPTNTSRWNTTASGYPGLGVLPPARPATHNYQQSAAITGPIYRYDGDLNSTVKLPPHFTRKWFVTDFNNSQISVITLNAAGTATTAIQRIFANHTFNNPTDFKAGPDGALYVIDYDGWFGPAANTGIVQIEYTGTCRPADPKLELPPTPVLNPGARFTTQTSGWVLNLGSGRPVMVPEGMVGFEIHDLMGRKLWEAKHLRSGETFTLPNSTLEKGALKYRWIPGIR